MSDDKFIQLKKNTKINKPSLSSSAKSNITPDDVDDVISIPMKKYNYFEAVDYLVNYLIQCDDEQVKEKDDLFKIRFQILRDSIKVLKEEYDN